jgi:hypothetical protein
MLRTSTSATTATPSRSPCTSHGPTARRARSTGGRASGPSRTSASSVRRRCHTNRSGCESRRRQTAVGGGGSSGGAAFAKSVSARSSRAVASSRSAGGALAYRKVIVELVRAAEGDRSAALAEHWLDREPEGFHVIRGPAGKSAGVIASAGPHPRQTRGPRRGPGHRGGLATRGKHRTRAGRRGGDPIAVRRDLHRQPVTRRSPPT